MIKYNSLQRKEINLCSFFLPLSFIILIQSQQKVGTRVLVVRKVRNWSVLSKEVVQGHNQRIGLCLGINCIHPFFVQG